MFSPNLPENVTQQVSLGLSSKPPFKIDDTRERAGPSTKFPGIRIPGIIDESRTREVPWPVFYSIFKADNTMRNTGLP